MNVIITGASRGIGRETALKFAKSALEVEKIFLISRNTERLEEIKSEILQENSSIEVNALSFNLNSQDESFHQLKEKISCSHIDILINNAGYLVNKPFNQLSSDEIAQMVQVNFTSVAGLLQALLGKFGGEKSTHIVNIGSMGGFQGSSKFPGLSIYSATKAALAILTECLAEEHADKNIYYNCLALGAVQTEMLNKAFPGYIAPVTPLEIADYIVDFALHGHVFFNGKILPVSLINPVR